MRHYPVFLDLRGRRIVVAGDSLPLSTTRS
jgi:hypothetical protein